MRFCAVGRVKIGHDFQGQRDAREAEGHVDQKHPVPAGVLHQIATHQRPDHRPQKRGHHDKVQPFEQLVLLIRPQNNQARHGHHHRPAQPLHHPRHHQHRQVRRGGAHQRAEHKQAHRHGKHFFRAVAVGDITAQRHKQSQRQRVGNHRRLHVQRALVQIRRHLRQRGVQHRGIEHLHEDAHRQQHRQPA